MRIVIKKIIPKEKDGKVTWLSIGDGKDWYGAPPTALSLSWRVGDVIDVPIEKKGQWNNIVLPKEQPTPQPILNQSAKITSVGSNDQLNEIIGLLKLILQAVDKTYNAPFGG